MDEAGARARISAMTRPPDVKEIEKEIEEIRADKEAAIKAQDFEKAAALRDKEKQAKEKLERILTEWREQREEKEVLVTDDDMMHVVSKWTGVPLQRMEQEETEKLLRDGSRTQGQGHRPGRSGHRHQQGAAPLAAPTSRIRAARSARSFSSARPAWARPSSPSTLAEFMFGDRDALIQIDMSRVHGEVHRLAPDRLASGLRRLRGGRPALRGRAPPALLRRALRRNRKGAPRRDAPAAPDPGGRQGHRLARPQDRFPQHDHHHDLERRRRADQAPDDDGLRRASATRQDYDEMRDKMLEEAKRVFKPEFLNRLDDIIVFHTLDKRRPDARSSTSRWTR